MNAQEFIREVYLAATPSIDIEATNETIDCCAHTIKLSDYERLLEEFAQGDRWLTLSANIWMCQSGPKVVKD